MGGTNKTSILYMIEHSVVTLTLKCWYLWLFIYILVLYSSHVSVDPRYKNTDRVYSRNFKCDNMCKTVAQYIEIQNKKKIYILVTVQDDMTIFISSHNMGRMLMLLSLRIVLAMKCLQCDFVSSRNCFNISYKDAEENSLRNWNVYIIYF